jgi:hypothetical protein
VLITVVFKRRSFDLAQSLETVLGWIDLMSFLVKVY